MVSKIPDPVADLGFEDTASIDNDINSLYAKFIVPIDKIRSIASPAPGILKMAAKDIPSPSVNTTKLMESRPHAFYRLLGLPVVAGTEFYNPGFDPKAENADIRTQINGKVDNTKSQDREKHLTFMQTLFGRQDATASFMALVMSKIAKPFKEEAFSIPARTAFIQAFVAKYTSMQDALSAAAAIVATSKVGATFNGGLHALKPLQTDPALEMSVMPYDNKICVPFLPDKESTKISSSPQKYLLRPGMEYILRARLIDSVPDTVFLQELENVLTQVKEGNQPADSNAQALKATLTALAEANDIENADINAIFEGFGATQASITTQLIKTMKTMVDELIFSYDEIDKISRNITFFPLPPAEGPEKIGTVKDIGGFTPLELTIVQLQIKKLNADSDIKISSTDLGTFATPFINLEKVTVYEDQITEKTQLKNSFVTRGLTALRTIEIITGEVSGLGLIDILAIYTALWTIKTEELLGLFDDDSFNRLYANNPSLQSADAVSSRNSGGGLSITDAMTALETRLDNILSFVDILIQNKFNSPVSNEGGEP